MLSMLLSEEKREGEKRRRQTAFVTNWAKLLFFLFVVNILPQQNFRSSTFGFLEEIEAVFMYILCSVCSGFMLS